MCACTDKDSETLTDKFDTEENISLVEAFPELKERLQAPSSFYCVDGYFVFSEPKLDTLVWVYDSHTKTSRSLFPKGQGDGEALRIANMGMGKTSTSCYLYDVALQCVYMLDLKDWPETSVVKDSLLSRLDGSKNSMAYDDTLSFYENVNAKKRFTLLSPSRTVHFGNDISVYNLSSESATKVVQGPCSLSPSQKRFFWFSSFGDVFELYDYADIDDIKTVRSWVFNLPNANADGALGPEARAGVTSVASDEKYIYALYLGKTVKEIAMNRSGALFSDMIMVFDWEGNPYKLLNLDRGVCSIAYNASDGKLYGLGIDDKLDYSLFEINFH